MENPTGNELFSVAELVGWSALAAVGMLAACGIVVANTSNNPDAIGWLLAILLVFGFLIVPIVWLIAFCMLAVANSVACGTGRRFGFAITCFVFGVFIALLTGGDLTTSVWHWLYVLNMIVIASIMMWVVRNRPLSVPSGQLAVDANDKLRQQWWEKLAKQLNAMGFGEHEIIDNLVDRGLPEVDAKALVKRLLS